MRMTSRAMAVGAVVGLFALVGTVRNSQAQTILGDQVTGVLNIFGYGSENFLDPANGFVPSGNGWQPTAVLTAGGLQFRFSDGYSNIGVDLGPASLDLFVLPVDPGNIGSAVAALDFYIDDLNSARVIDSFALVTGTIPGMTYSLVNPHQVHVHTPQSYFSQGGLQASFTVGTRTQVRDSSVPEPSSLAMLFGAGIVGTSVVLRRKRA